MSAMTLKQLVEARAALSTAWRHAVIADDAENSDSLGAEVRALSAEIASRVTFA